MAAPDPNDKISAFFKIAVWSVVGLIIIAFIGGVIL